MKEIEDQPVHTGELQKIIFPEIEQCRSVDLLRGEWGTVICLTVDGSGYGEGETREDHIDTGFNKVEAGEDAEADGKYGGMGNGIDIHEDLQDAQHNAGHKAAEALIFDRERIDDG